MDYPLRVLIVDENDLYRQTMRTWLENTDGLAVVGEAQDGQGAMELIGELEPEVILFGADTLRLDDVQTVAYINERYPHSKILVLGTYEAQDRLVLDLFRKGAWGYLDKGDSQPPDIVEAVRAVSRGGAILSPGMAAWILDEIAQMQQKRSTP
jgi:DNA-binding NarL/FixJ family response regulator